jgi:hypothetical protein
MFMLLVLDMSKQTYDGEGRQSGLLTFDGRIGNPPLRIVVPKWTGQLPTNI